MSKTNEQLMDLLLSIIGATHCIPSRVTCGIQFWEMTKEQYQDFLDSDDTKHVGQDEGGTSYRFGIHLICSVLNGSGSGWVYEVAPNYFIGE